MQNGNEKGAWPPLGSLIMQKWSAFVGHGEVGLRAARVVIVTLLGLVKVTLPDREST